MRNKVNRLEEIFMRLVEGRGGALDSALAAAPAAAGPQRAPAEAPR
jgi:hypothetical protein